MNNKQQTPDEGLLLTVDEMIDIVTFPIEPDFELSEAQLAKAKPIWKKQVEEEMLEVLNREYPVRVVWQRYKALKERNNE